jgi:FkbM family methyltransferase
MAPRKRTVRTGNEKDVIQSRQQLTTNSWTSPFLAMPDRVLEAMMRPFLLATAAAGVLVVTGPFLVAREPPSGKPGPSSTVAARKSIVATEKKLYSHGKEEIIIRDFFQDRRGGFFLDVGCGRPIQDSNSYYLEEHLQWSGIGVDALPDMASKWKKSRPASKFFNFIVTDHAETVEPFYRAKLKVRDISSIQKPETGPGGGAVQSEEIQIPTTTLTKLLEESGVAKVDFLSMDIEGAELLALAGFDVERFRPELACIEAKPVNRAGILKYFADHGYVKVDRYQKYDRTNYYFAPRVSSAR